MRRLWKVLFSWISARGASIVAISSVAIALASLYLTIQAQKEDRTYKELMIRPSISISVHPHDFSVGFRNDGLGPARFEEIIYHLGGECLTMFEADGVSLSRDDYIKVRKGLEEPVPEICTGR
jgi:hypothetical protein